MTNALQRLVATLRDTDLSHVEIDDLVRELRPHTKGAFIKAPQFEPGALLFRGRLVDRVSSVHELSHPPAFLTPIGRLNRPGSPLFYASPSRSAIFFELPLTVGATLLISRWRTMAPMLLNHVGYHRNIFERLGSARGVAGWDGKTNPHGTYPEFGSLWNSLGDLFTEEVPSGQEFRYKLSVAVAECMFGDPFAGVLYPSVAMWANADNVALQAAWARSNLQFVGVEAIRVRAIEGRKLNVDSIDYATSADGVALEWKGRPYHWQIREQGAALKFVSTGEIWREKWSRFSEQVS